MKRYKIMKIVMLVTTIALLGGYVFAGLHTKKTETKVKTYTIKKVDPYVFQGTVDATRSESISIDPSLGKLHKVHVHDGQLIRKDQLLLTYKNSSVVSQLSGQRKTVQRARRSYVNAYDDYIKLANKKKKTAMEKESVKTLKSTMESTRDAYTDAKDALADLESKRYHRVRSSITGYVALDNNARDNVSLPFITVTSSKIEVVGQVSEFDYEKLKTNATVDLEIISSEKKMKGTITKIDKVPNSGSGEAGLSSLTGSSSGNTTSSYNFYVEPESDIQYGYSVEISLPVNEIQIPKKYVKKGSDGYFVYLYKDKKKVKTDVTVTEKDDYYVVNTGLAVNDKVVIKS